MLKIDVEKLVYKSVYYYLYFTIYMCCFDCNKRDLYLFRTIINSEKESKELELIKSYDTLFSSDDTSKTYTECNVFKNGSKEHNGAKKLCNKLLYLLENIVKNPTTTDNVKRCSYLRYWFYDQIRGIYDNHSKMIGEITFIKELIDIRSKVHKNELKNMCDIPYDKDVNLDEWRKRKLSYIYFKNHDNIKNISISTKKAECDKRSKYVEIFWTKIKFSQKKRKKKIFEHNYYEEYEKELEKYESENESLDSQSDQYFLNYQPERDYYY
ncbi:CYIR protein [Plasmodium cynomolgi strain B]|uniref:CYIR protein n=1 Tax=Plasmodium cynomolgi (strain B) TaxID=1120755 RepID=K6UZJ8_PLACD|nr:CYIR protein [Plasmodium cynomolgi strain B]GAB69414.1 CYIR protein [Plasmodium cynomolgi strain B]